MSHWEKIRPLIPPLWQRHGNQVTIAIVAMVASFLFLFTVPLISKSALDRLSTSQNDPFFALLERQLTSLGLPDDLLIYGQLALSGALIVLATAVAGYFVYLRGRSIALAAEGMSRHLRDQLMDHLNHLPMNFHQKADTGDLIQRCTSDIETFRVFISGQSIEIARAVLMLIVVLPILFALDSDMAWIALVTFPFLMVSAIFFFNKVKALFLNVDEAEAELTSVLQENLTGIRVVRAFARQPFEINKFSKANRGFREENKRLLNLLGWYYGMSDIVCLGQIGLILIVGAEWVLADRMSVGTLFAFLTYESMIIWPIRHMGRVLTDSGKAVVALGRIADILGEPVETLGEQSPPTRLRGRIKAEQLTFKHDANDPLAPLALDHIDLTIQAGETIGIVGAPGSGKSTLIQVLLRIYDATEGTIWLDDFALPSLSRKYVRGQVSVVLQESFLFAGTIADNLRLGKPDATASELEHVARIAQIHETIAALPNGYQSMIGERGVNLSGGQRQRLAIARALLKDPAILVLDDALSAVDTDTESMILDALRDQAEGIGARTTLIISHRLSSIMLADRIVVLDKGRINQSGNHAALLNEPGIYQDLCRVQGAVQDEIDALVKPQAKSQTALDGQANRSGDVSVDTHLQPTIPSKIGPSDE